MILALELALAQLLRRRRQGVVSVLGVTLGVGFFIAMAAMMQGFQRDFVARVIDVQPHVVVKDEFRRRPAQAAELAAGPRAAVELRGEKPVDEPRGIRGARAIAAALGDMPGVAVAPNLAGQVFLRYGTREVAATLTGIDPAAERRVGNLERDLVEGSLDALHVVANGLVLGEALARKLGARPGTTLSLSGTQGVVLKAKVVGVFRTGITSLDTSVAYALLAKAQVVLERPNVVNQLRLRLARPEDARDFALRVEERFGYRAESWHEANANVLGIFVIQRAIMYSTIGAILVVAGFGIFNVVSTVAWEKARDVAILKSIGFRERDILLVFLLQGLLVGVAGMVLGWLLGFLIVAFMGSLRFEIEGFVRLQGFVLHRTPVHYALAGAFALATSALAAWIPARRAARAAPVDMLRGAT
ncbi:MAG: ABC transporter permease [Alphaproteobacteria bacterium]